MYSENGKFPFKGCYNISIKLIYYPIFSSAIWICLKLNPLMATQIKDGLHFFSTSLPGSAYLSNAFTIISSLYILQSVKRPKYLFPPSIKICNVFLVKEIKSCFMNSKYRRPILRCFWSFCIFSYSWFTHVALFVTIKEGKRKERLI